MTPSMFFAFNGVLRALIGVFCAKRGHAGLGAAFTSSEDLSAYPIARVFSGSLAADVRTEGSLSAPTRAYHAKGLALLEKHPDAGRDLAIREAFEFYTLVAFTDDRDLGEELAFLASHWPSFVDLIEKDVCASDVLETLGGAWDVITNLSILTDRMVPCCGTCAGCLRH